MIGVDWEEWVTNSADKHVHGGSFAEGFVAQELGAYSNASVTNPLVYWNRIKRGSTAEIDNLLE